MTVKIPKSLIAAFDPPFDVQVAELAEKVRHWREHMGRVKADEANDKIAAADKHQAFDRPRSSPLVESAIDGQGNPDYEISDDGDLMLRSRKNALLNAVAQVEQAAIEKLVPPGKVRLFNMRESRILSDDKGRATSISQKSNVISKIFGSGDIAAAVRDARPSEDTRHLDMMQGLREQIDQIRQQAAQVMHDIEDLTADTIKQWKMPDFGAAK